MHVIGIKEYKLYPYHGPVFGGLYTTVEIMNTKNSHL